MTRKAARGPRFYSLRSRLGTLIQPPTTMTNARILIVEDEAITVAALKRELTSLGYEVAGTSGATDEALKAVELHKPDLVLMDITLSGGINGIVAALAIRGN